MKKNRGLLFLLLACLLAFCSMALASTPEDDNQAPDSFDAAVVADALKLAQQVQQNLNVFWQDCDQKEYAWLQRIPGYDITKPEAAGVLYITQPQLDALANKLGGKDGVATGFATYLNQQSNLPYTRASQLTAQSDRLSPIPDGSCVIVALVWQTDTVLAIIQADGSAQAALICSTQDLINTISPDTIQKIATEFGVAGGACSVYKGGEIATLLNQQGRMD